MAAIAWLLNLGAELELADPRNHRPTPVLAARIAALTTQMTTLLAPHDRIIGVDGDVADSDLALAFCPTPSALHRIADAGLTPPAAPPIEVLAQVNRRAFGAGLGQTLPKATYVRDLAALRDVIARPSPSGTWLLKRDFSFAGRERCLVDAPVLPPATEGFARRSFARGEGLQVEPLVTRSADFAQHGYVLDDGEVLLGSPMAQTIDARGVWQCSAPCPDGTLDEDERRALTDSTVVVGDALARAGYHGPFGVDAFRYRIADGHFGFQPRSELNARFSMGYPRALLERALARMR